MLYRIPRVASVECSSYDQLSAPTEKVSWVVLVNIYCEDVVIPHEGQTFEDVFSTLQGIDIRSVHTMRCGNLRRNYPERMLGRLSEPPPDQSIEMLLARLSFPASSKYARAIVADGWGLAGSRYR